MWLSTGGGALGVLNWASLLVGVGATKAWGSRRQATLFLESVWPDECLCPFADPQGSSNSPVLLMEDEHRLVLTSVCCSAVMISSQSW